MTRGLPSARWQAIPQQVLPSSAPPGVRVIYFALVCASHTHPAGITSPEMIDLTGLSPRTYYRRFSEARRLGMVAPAGVRGH
jgi:hypothetical protein